MYRTLIYNEFINPIIVLKLNKNTHNNTYSEMKPHPFCNDSYCTKKTCHLTHVLLFTQILYRKKN